MKQRGTGERPIGRVFDQHTLPRRPDVIERSRNARGDFAAGLVGNERDALLGLNREADLDRISRARLEIRRWWPEQGLAHPSHCTFHVCVFTFH